MDRIEEILQAMISAEREGAALMMDAHEIMAEMKSGHRDVVTEYDRRVQELIMRRLRGICPQARFFCEENDVHEELCAEDVFIIDPIDGTMNFVRHMNHSCISVAYMHAGTVQAAAVYNPYVDELFTARRGGGAFLNGRQIYAEAAPLSETLALFGTAPYNSALAAEVFDMARRVFENSLDVRRCGSAELDLCAVAAGRAGMYFEHVVSLWDYAAGALIVSEAGGVCTTIEGAPLTFGAGKSSIAAGGYQAHADFIALTRKAR